MIQTPNKPVILKNCTDPASEQGQMTGSQARPILPAEAASSPPPRAPRFSGTHQDGPPIAHHWGPREEAAGNREVLSVNTQGNEITKGSYTQKLQRRIACPQTSPGNMDVKRVPVKTCRMVSS